MKYLVLLLFIPFALFAQQNPVNRYPLIRQALAQKYAQVSPFYTGGKVIVSSEAKYGYISAEGKAITPFIYQNGHNFVYNLAKVQQNKLWGCINSQGKDVIPCMYNNLEIVHRQFIIAEKEGKKGIINAQNELILPFEYEAIITLKEMSGLYKYRKQSFLERVYSHFFVVAVKSKEKWGMIDATGKTIMPVIYDNIELMHIDSVAGTYLLIAQKDKKECLFDTKTQTEISPYFDYLAFYANHEGKLYFKIGNQGQEGIMRDDGKMVIPLEEQFIEGVSGSDYYYLQKKSKKVLLNNDFEVLKPTSYDDILVEQEVIILTKNDSLPQKLWINPQDREDSFGGERAWIKQAYQTTLLNAQGKEILKPGHWCVASKPTQGFPFMIVQKEDSFALMRTNGKMAVPLQKAFAMIGQTGAGLKIAHIMQIDTLRDTVKSFTGNPFAAQQNGIIKIICDDGKEAHIIKELSLKMQYGYADTLGNVVIPCMYDNIIALGNDYFAVQKAGKWGVIYQTKQQILPFAYTAIEGVTEEKSTLFISTNADMKKELWNEAGKKVAKAYFDEIRYEGDFVICENRQKHQIWLYDRYGKRLKPYPYHQIIENGGFSTAYNPQVYDIYIHNQAQPVSIKRKNRTFLSNPNEDFIYFCQDSSRQVYFWEKEKGKWFLKNLQQEKAVALGFDEVNLLLNGNYEAKAYFKDSVIWELSMEMNFYGVRIIHSLPITDTLYTKSNTRFVRFGDLWGLQDAQGKMILPQEYGELAYNENENIAVLAKNRSRSLLDSTQKPLLTDCEAILPTENVFCYKKNNLWGMVDSVGNELLAPCLNDLHYIKYFDNAPAWARRQAVYLAEVKNQKGLIDIKGRWRVLPKYDALFFTKTNFILGKKGEKAGLIDSTGKEIVPFVYDYLPNYNDEDNILPLYQKYDKRGELPELPPAINWMRDFTFLKKAGNYHLVQMTTGKDFALKTGEGQPEMRLISSNAFVIKDTLCSYVFDKKGNLRFKIIADLIPVEKERNSFPNNTTLPEQYPLIITKTFDSYIRLDEWGFGDDWSFGFTPITKPIKYGIIDTLGKEILQMKYDKIHAFYQGYAVIGQNGKYGLIDSTGKFKTQLVYDSMVYVKGFYIVGKAKKGIVAFDGREVVPQIYEKIFATDIENGYVKVKKGEKWGLMHISGQEILPFEYEELAGNAVAGLWVAMKDHHCGIIRQRDKKMLVPFEYEGLQIVLDSLGDTLLIFQQNCLYGLMQLDGKIIASAQYLFIKHLASTLFAFAESNMYGLIDASSGKVILSKCYKMAEIEEFLSDILFIKIGKNYASGIWNTKTHTWQTPFYEECRILDKTKDYLVLRVYQKEEKKYMQGIMDRQGKWIFEPEIGEWKINYPFFIFTQNGKNKLYNDKWQNLLPLDSGNISILKDSLSAKNYFVQANKIFTDKREVIVLPIKVDRASNLSENSFAFFYQGKIGFMGLDGKILIAPTYDGVSNGFRNGIAKVVKGEVSLFIDIKGNVLGEVEY